MKITLNFLVLFLAINCSAQVDKTFSFEVEGFLSSKVGSKTMVSTSPNIYMEAKNGRGFSLKVFRNIQYEKIGYSYGLGYSSFGLAYSYVSNEGFKSNNWQDENSFRPTALRWGNMFSSFSLHFGITRMIDLSPCTKISASAGLKAAYFGVGTSGVISSNFINDGSQAINLFKANVTIKPNSNLQGGGELNISYLKQTKRNHWRKYGLSYGFLLTPSFLESEMILYGDNENLVQNVKASNSTLGLSIGLIF